MDSTKKKKKRIFSPNTDCSDYVMRRRFKEIKMFSPDATSTPQRKEDDDWWRLSAQVEKHRERRQNRVVPSHVFVFDESMSAFVPR